jgi:hypothetical protein
MLKIIKIQPAYGKGLESVDPTDALGSRDPGIIRLKSQGDKGLETSGTIL